MNRLQEYHGRSLDVLHYAGIVALLACWIGLFALSGHLPEWQMILLIGAVALLTAAFGRHLTTRKSAGAWTTDTHLNIYCGHKHWSFPLSGIRAIGARSAPFFAQAPHLELTSGRKVQLPLTCLPPAPELRRWFDGKPIRVDAKLTLT